MTPAFGASVANSSVNTRTCPIFRTGFDAELTRKLYARTPILINEAKGDAGNPWGITFLAMFHMSNDSGLFVDNAELADKAERPDESGCGATRDLFARAEAEGLRPLFEAKMIHQFDHRWATYEDDGKTSRDMTWEEKQDPNTEPQPRYWVPEGEVTDRLAAKGWNRRWLMGWRDIARATDERTTISGVIPRVACGDKYLLMMPAQEPELCACLLGNINALVADFCARQKLGGTSFKYFTMRQIAYLPPAFYTEPRLAFITPRVLELTYTSHSLSPFARDLGHDGPPFAWEETRRAVLRAELDAFYARAYGLTRDELRYILDPAEVMGPDYPSETFRVLKEKEIRKYGEYRTARLVLQAWDRMEASGELAA